MFGLALIVDGSAVCRSLFTRFLAPIAIRTQGAANLEEAVRILDAAPTVDLVLVDMDAPGGGALGLMDHLDKLDRPRPHVIVLTLGGDADRDMAISRTGVASVLHKPVSFGAMARAAWKISDPGASLTATAERKEYGSPVSAAVLDEQRRGLFECEVRNLSSSGALLLTSGSLDVGALLSLRLQAGGRSCEVRARVVRVQDPGWAHHSGIGVQFIEAHPADLAELLAREDA